MTAFLSFTVVGLVIGCIYALTATGLVVTYTTSGIFNFAHGAIGMFGAFTYWQLTVAWGLPALLALPLMLLVLAPLFGAVVERVLMRPLHGAPVDLTLVVTLGLLVFLLGAAQLLWSPADPRTLPEFFPGSSVRIFSFSVSYHQLTCIAAALIVAAFLRLLFGRTRIGIAMRAVVDNPQLVAMAGGRPVRVQQLSWALGASLAALAGILLAPLYQLDIFVLTLLVINGYAAAMVGRLKSLPLTIVGALLLGLLTTYAVGYVTIDALQRIQLAIPMILLFGVLIVLPPARLRVATTNSIAAPRPGTLGGSLVGGVVLVVTALVLSRVLPENGVAAVSTGLALAFVLLSLVLVTGYGGLASLCQMTFAGLGAFAMGTFAPGGSVFGIVAAVALAAAVGALVALPTLKLRGLYLALATLAFAYTMEQVFFTQVLGSGGTLEVPRPSLPGIPTDDRSYLVTLALTFACIAIGVLTLRRGPFGRRLSALDDSPAACATLGLNVNWTKLTVFTLAAGLAGLGGVFFASVPGQASTDDFVLLNSLVVLLLARIGGINTVSGALFGALLFALFPLVTNTFEGLREYQQVLIALGAISLARDPNALGGKIAGAAEALRSRRTKPPAARPAVPATTEERELAQV